MDAVLLACLAGALFGAHGVSLRAALHRVPDAESGAFYSAAFGFLIVLPLVAIFREFDDVDFTQLWPFLALGVIVPGFSQVFFVRGVKDIGASRTLVIVATAPLIAAIGAVIFLDEPLRAALAVGTILIVAGGGLLAWEPSRPADYRIVGVFWVLAAVALFATRDNLARWLAGERGTPPGVAAAALLGAATVTIFIYLMVTRSDGALADSLRAGAAPFFATGALFGLAYATFLAALDRGPVTVVSPLNGTYALWGVLFSFLLIGHIEAVGRHLVLAAVLVVAGAALIGAVG